MMLSPDRSGLLHALAQVYLPSSFFYLILAGMVVVAILVGLFMFVTYKGFRRLKFSGRRSGCLSVASIFLAALLLWIFYSSWTRSHRPFEPSGMHQNGPPIEAYEREMEREAARSINR
ncbi:hypothetical protein-transmembrane prediction [Rhodopirellula baltica SH 1]|uniref:Uncharacterized protein n=1 Tax=Rhodopirellula baltica (strain DSM 10527 / NCIMB 13988 / SH1) TaxID=243090 RepID=Q7UIZ4_RHOBA|nr:hypothetical protein-transmembrane prediction [Rhodopirellula baltica SH 1]